MNLYCSVQLLQDRFSMRFPVLLVVSRAGRTAGTTCDLHCVSVCWEMEAKTQTKLKTNERKYFI